MSEINELEKDRDEENSEDEEEVPLLKQKKVRKPMEKKPRSEAQIAQFQRVIEKKRERDENARNLRELNAAKLLLKQKDEQRKSKKDDVVAPIEDSSSSSSEEEEVIVVKKKKEKKVVVEKKKKKKYVIELSDSSEDEPDQPVPHATRKMISQQNKKSLIKVHSQNFFAD